jgi:hypothetical protein
MCATETYRMMLSELDKGTYFSPAEICNGVASEIMELMGRDKTIDYARNGVTTYERELIEEFITEDGLDVQIADIEKRLIERCIEAVGPITFKEFK